MPSDLAMRAALALAATLVAAPARSSPPSDAPSAHCAQHAAARSADASAAASPAADDAATDVTIADVPLVDQDGRAVRFPAAIGDDVVVMNFVFTTCTTVCPVLSSIFSGVQRQLADRSATGVRLVSLSIDPVRDTPARLKAQAAKHKAGPGWTWLTGKTEDVEKALRGAGAYTPDFVNHAPMVLVGDARAGRWFRLNGMPSPDRVMEKVDALRALRSGTTAMRTGR